MPNQQVFNPQTGQYETRYTVPVGFDHPATQGEYLPLTPEQEEYLNAKVAYDNAWNALNAYLGSSGGPGTSPVNMLTGEIDDPKAKELWDKVEEYRSSLDQMEQEPYKYVYRERGESLQDVITGYSQEELEAPQLDPYIPMEYQQEFYGAAVPTGIYEPYSKLEAEGRAQQLEALGLTREAAMGLAPSEAELMMQMGLDEATKAQIAAANAARGGAGAAMRAQRIAAEQGAAARQAGVREMGALRAREMAEARAAFGLGTEQLRTSDLGRLEAEQKVALTEAEFQQEAGMLGEKARIDTMIENARLGNDQAIANLNAELKTQGLTIEQRIAMIQQLTGIAQDQLEATIRAEEIEQGVYQGQQTREFEERMQHRQLQTQRELSEPEPWEVVGGWLGALAAPVSAIGGFMTGVGTLSDRSPKTATETAGMTATPTPKSGTRLGGSRLTEGELRDPFAPGDLRSPSYTG